MIKISNIQASAFTSPLISKLFSDESRPFPIEDAFKLSDMIQEIQKKASAYRAAVVKVVEQFDGIIADDGVVTYPNTEKQALAVAEVEKLNAVELEYPGEKLTPNDQWPKLSIAEATILRPLLNGKKSEQI